MSGFGLARGGSPIRFSCVVTGEDVRPFLFWDGKIDIFQNWIIMKIDLEMLKKFSGKEKNNN